jgi:hypothetical protein
MVYLVLSGWVAVCIETFLDLFPDVVAGLVSGLKQEAGLIGDVLEVADEGRTVIAGLQVSDQGRVLGNAVAARCEEVGKLLLKVGTGDGDRGFRIRVLRCH